MTQRTDARLERILRPHFNAINSHLNNIYTDTMEEQAFFEFMLRHIFLHIPIVKLPLKPFTGEFTKTMNILYEQISHAVVLLLTGPAAQKLWPNRDVTKDQKFGELLDTYIVKMLENGTTDEPVARTLVLANRVKSTEELEQHQANREERDAGERKMVEAERVSDDQKILGELKQTQRVGLEKQETSGPSAGNDGQLDGSKKTQAELEHAVDKHAATENDATDTKDENDVLSSEPSTLSSSLEMTTLGSSPASAKQSTVAPTEQAVFTCPIPIFVDGKLVECGEKCVSMEALQDHGSEKHT